MSIKEKEEEKVEEKVEDRRKGEMHRIIAPSTKLAITQKATERILIKNATKLGCSD